MATKLQYRIIGKYTDGREVAEYLLQCSNGEQKRLGKEPTYYLVGKGQVENATGQLYKDKVLLRAAEGESLDNLPTFPIEEKSVKTTSDTSEIVNKQPERIEQPQNPIRQPRQPIQANTIMDQPVENNFDPMSKESAYNNVLKMVQSNPKYAVETTKSAIKVTDKSTGNAVTVRFKDTGWSIRTLNGSSLMDNYNPTDTIEMYLKYIEGRLALEVDPQKTIKYKSKAKAREQLAEYKGMPNEVAVYYGYIYIIKSQNIQVREYPVVSKNNENNVRQVLDAKLAVLTQNNTVNIDIRISHIGDSSKSKDLAGTSSRYIVEVYKDDNLITTLKPKTVSKFGGNPLLVGFGSGKTNLKSEVDCDNTGKSIAESFLNFTKTIN